MTEHLKRLNIVFFALFFGQVMIMFVLQTLSTNSRFIQRPIIFGIGAGLMILQVFLSTYLFKKRLSEIDEDDTIEQKLEDYRAACIIRWALLEGAVIVNAILFFLFENQINLLVSVVGLGIFFLSRPTKITVFNDLNLHGIDEDI